MQKIYFDYEYQLTIIEKPREYLSNEILNVLLSFNDFSMTNFVQPVMKFDDEFYYAKYIEGKSLDQIISDKQLSAEESFEFITEMICALNYIHSYNVVHRDIKPANIVRGNDGNYYLIDFGAARIINRNTNRDTVLLGTAMYAAPEQYGFEQSSYLADYYAFGKTISEVCTDNAVIREIVAKLTSHYPEHRSKTLGEIEGAIQQLTQLSPAQNHGKTFRVKNVIKQWFSLKWYMLADVLYFIMIIPGLLRDNANNSAYGALFFAVITVYFILSLGTKLIIESPIALYKKIIKRKEARFIYRLKILSTQTIAISVLFSALLVALLLIQ